MIGGSADLKGGEIILGHSEAAVSCNSGDLSVSVITSPDVAGSPLTYTITVSNSGPDAVTGIYLVSGEHPQQPRRRQRQRHR